MRQLLGIAVAPYTRNQQRHTRLPSNTGGKPVPHLLCEKHRAAGDWPRLLPSVRPTFPFHHRYAAAIGRVQRIEKRPATLGHKGNARPVLGEKNRSSLETLAATAGCQVLCIRPERQ